jgi:hypothetical protein
LLPKTPKPLVISKDKSINDYKMRNSSIPIDESHFDEYAYYHKSE